MSFPDIVKSVYTMNNSDINIVGEHLGYDWNEVCEAISDAGYYAEDGDGAFNVEREVTYSSNEIINKIMIAIFDNYPEMQCLTIINE